MSGMSQMQHSKPNSALRGVVSPTALVIMARAKSLILIPELRTTPFLA